MAALPHIAASAAWILVESWLVWRTVRLAAREPVWASKQAEVLDLRTKRWKPTAVLPEPVRWPLLARREDGTVLAALDRDPLGKVPTIQRYAPDTNAWSRAPTAKFSSGFPDEAPEDFDGEVLSWPGGALAWEALDEGVRAFRSDEQQWVATSAPPKDFEPCGACGLPSGDLFLVGIRSEKPCTLRWQRELNQWSTSLAPPPLLPSFGSVLAALDDQTLVALLSDERTTQCAVFSLTENTWSPLPSPSLVDAQCTLLGLGDQRVLAVGGTSALRWMPVQVFRKCMLALTCAVFAAMGLRYWSLGRVVTTSVIAGAAVAALVLLLVNVLFFAKARENPAVKP